MMVYQVLEECGHCVVEVKKEQHECGHLAHLIVHAIFNSIDHPYMEHLQSISLIFFRENKVYTLLNAR